MADTIQDREEASDADPRYFFATPEELDNRLNTGYDVAGVPPPQDRPTHFEQIPNADRSRGGFNRIGTDQAWDMPLQGDPVAGG